MGVRILSDKSEQVLLPLKIKNRTMILATDIYYFDDKAKAVAVAFECWTDEQPTQVFICQLDKVEEYVPGEFYKRELPCILEVLKQTDLSKVEAIVVDGYVILDDNGKIGLGGHLFYALGGTIPIIGVAKTNFARNTLHVVKLYRGDSQRPLFVTAMGMDVSEAANHIRGMAGEFRLPTLLKEVDKISKDI